jgi:hypothetical protein
MKRFAAVAFVLLLFAGIGGAFWYEDWRYSLPTPKPRDLKQEPLGTRVALPASISQQPGRPLHIHFFNSGCPCSRFNLDHFKSLVRRYRGRVDFVAVVQGRERASSLAKFDKHRIGIPSVYDQERLIARDLGVYSTPQAVILDRQGQLYFRGNYNKTRYCTARETEYARAALDSLVAGLPAPVPAPAAVLAYGCELPR